MSQNVTDAQVLNLSIAGADASGNPVTPTFDSPPTWTLVDPSSSGATLVPSADGLTAVLTPGAVGSSLTVNLTAVNGGSTFTASLDVTVSSSGLASISIVAVAVPKPAPTPPTPTPAPTTP